MIDRQPSLGRYFTLLYEDLLRVIRSMWPAVLTIAAAIMVVDFLSDIVGGFIATRLGQGVLTVLATAAITWLTAPYLVALYRAVDGDEVTTRPESLRNLPATQRFAAWSVLLVFIAGVPAVLFRVFIPDVPPEQLTPDDVNAFGMLVLLVVSIAVMIFSVRITTLMPQLALDPERASLQHALAQTKGQFWFIVGVECITLVPLLLGSFVVADILMTIIPILQTPISAAIAALIQVAQIAVATRLYQRYAGR